MIMHRVEMSRSIPILLISALLAACHGGSPSQPSKGAVYRKALYAKVLTYDPAQMTDTASLSVTNQIYDGLLEFGEHFALRPALAESWQNAEDGKTLTFKLRSGVRFHDGSLVTSADCVHSFERMLAKESLIEKYYGLIEGAEDFRAGKAPHVRGLQAPTPSTFVIRLKNKFPPFATILAGATAKILPHKLVDRPGFFERPVGTGAFKFLRADESEVVLTRNADYWREPAEIAELDYVIGDEAKGMALAKKGLLDDLVTYPLNGDEVIFGTGQHLQVPVIATWIIGMNTRIAPFESRQARLQFRSAFSSQEFVRQFYPGQIVADGGSIPPGLPGNGVKASPVSVPKKIYRDPFIVAIPEVLAKAQAIRADFESRLHRAGFLGAHVRLMDWNELYTKYNAKKLPSWLMSMTADYPDPEFLFRNFEGSNSDNFSGIRSAKIDQLIRLTRTLDSRLERGKVYRRLTEIIENEALTVNLLYYRAHYWFSSRVSGVELNSLGDVYIPYRKVRLNGGSSREVARHGP